MFHLCENRTDHKEVNGVKGAAFERTWADIFCNFWEESYMWSCVFMCVRLGKESW